jgi:hypothetical protein
VPHYMAALAVRAAPASRKRPAADDELLLDEEEEDGGRDFDMPVLQRIESSLRDLKADVSCDDLMDAATELFERWSMYRAQPMGSNAHAYEAFGLGKDGPLDVQQLQARSDREWDRIVALYHRMCSTKDADSKPLIDLSNNDDIAGQRFVRMCRIVECLRTQVLMDHSARCAMDSSLPVAGASSALSTFRAHLVPREDLNPVQELILHTLECAKLDDYRMLDGYVMQQVRTEHGVPTHAWERVPRNPHDPENNKFLTLEDFVFRCSAKEKYPQQWRNRTHGRGGNTRAVVTDLEGGEHYELPRVYANRHLFSFKNGVYDVSSNEFHPHVDDPNPLAPDSVACNFFPVDMPYEALLEYGRDWRRIPTPYFESIMTKQQLPLDVKDWLMAMMGRLLYAMDDKDHWQIVPFIMGDAGTGKSTLCRVMLYVYGPAFMGVLTNDIEDKFGLKAFQNKKAYVSLEIKKTFKLPQTQFQSMITGEEMTVQEKHKTAEDNFKWRSHGLLAGNELPGYEDKSGSISRRIVLFLFRVMIDDSDPMLMEKIKGEIALILYKINAAYREMTDRYCPPPDPEHPERSKHPGIWSVLPNYFTQTRRELRASTHSLAHFLITSKDIEVRPELFMPESDFKNMLRQHQDSNTLSKSAWTKEFYDQVFKEFKIGVVTDTRTYNGTLMSNINWVQGVDVAGSGAPASSSAAAASGASGASGAAAAPRHGAQTAALDAAVASGKLVMDPGA